MENDKPGDDKSITKLYDILSESELEAVRSEVPRIAPLLAEHQYDIISDRKIPIFADYTRRLRSARSDLRKGFLLLSPVKKSKIVK